MWLITILFLIVLICIIIVSLAVFKVLSQKSQIQKHSEQLDQMVKKIDEYREVIKCSSEDTMEFKRRQAFITESVLVGTWDYNVVEEKIFFSEKCFELLGIDRSHSYKEVLKDFCQNLSLEEYSIFLKTVYQVFERKKYKFRFNCRLEKRTGFIRWLEIYGNTYYDEYGKLMQVAGSITDVTGNKIYEEEIERLAYFDTLTRFPNRTGFEQKVNVALEKKPDTKAAFLYMDIDDFKYINDSFGHYFGDKVIIEMAGRIQAISPDYVVGRFGGDEMVVFIDDYVDREDLLSYVDKLYLSLNINYSDDEIDYKISVSIGVATYPDHGRNFGELLQGADIALNIAKASGKSKYIFFNNQMYDQFQERAAMEKELRVAIENGNELQLYLQPQYHIGTGQLYGFEALTRWISPTRGFVGPSEFIPLAEETLLIVPIGRWVIQESCRILKELSNRGYDHIKISANLSTVQLIDDGLVAAVTKTIHESEINPLNLELEITESILMENFDSNVKKLDDLKALGLSIAMDDFGTGYSSLTYLKILPMSTLKIDKSFIDHITNSEIDRKIINEIIRLSHVLGYDTIAEGVESLDQLNHLKEFGCDVVQGYIGGRPMPSQDIFLILDKKLVGHS